MAQFAQLDENNIITQVSVVADEDCLDGDGNKSEAVGIAFCVSLWGSETFIEDTPERKRARIGCTYDAAKDVFIDPQPSASWTLNSENDWEPPISYPDTTYDGPEYYWNEVAYQADNSTGWVEI